MTAIPSMWPVHCRTLYEVDYLIRNPAWSQLRGTDFLMHIKYLCYLTIDIVR